MDTQNSGLTPGASAASSDPASGYGPVHGSQPYGQPGYNQQPYGQQAYPPQPGAYQPNYQQQPYGQPGVYPPAANQGLSDTAAGALAYVTIIPAIIFLVMAPYNQRPFIKFNAFQCLFMAATWLVASFVAIIPVIGWLVSIVVFLTLLVMWVLCIVNASQGKIFKVPVIGDYAAQQAGLM
jgi:uncharacterized membrane protein